MAVFPRWNKRQRTFFSIGGLGAARYTLHLWNLQTPDFIGESLMATKPN
jgi:hypothetical protein